MLQHALAPRFSFGIFHRPGTPLVEVLATDPAQYRAIAEQNSITAYISIAATFLILWDWVINLEDEIRYIWKRRTNSSGKPMYLLVRYAGTAFQMFGAIVHLRGWNASVRDYDCTTYYYVDPIGTAVLLSILDLLLGYRVLCLYRMKRSLVIFNVVFYLICLVLFGFIVSLGYRGFSGIDTPRGMTGCFCTIGSWLIFMSCVPGLLFEMWLFGLAVYRVAAFSKATRRGLPDVLCLLLKDSISWFFIIAVMIVWNIFSLIAAPTGSHTIAIAPFHAAIIVCGCRLIIRMRKSAAEEGHYLEPTNNSGVAHTQNDDVSEWSHDLQDVSFDDRRKKSEDNSARTSDSVKQIETTATAVHNKRPQQHRVIGSGADRSGRASSLDIVAARRFVGIAQKLGLPPALNSDFNALWQEPQSFLDMDDDSPPAEFVQMQRIDVSRRISVVPGPRQPYLMRSSLSRSPELPDMSRKGQSNSLALREEDEDIVFSRPTNPCSGDELHGRHSSLDV